MSDRQERVEHIKTHASKRLRMNLRILSIVYLILLVITLVDVIRAQAIFYQVLIAIIIGLIVGILSARMFKITWDEHEEEVVGRIDIYGVVVLILFAVFELNRSHVASLFAGGDSVGSIGFVLITAALFGRIFATSRKILRVLREQDII